MPIFSTSPAGRVRHVEQSTEPTAAPDSLVTFAKDFGGASLLSGLDQSGRVRVYGDAPWARRGYMVRAMGGTASVQANFTGTTTTLSSGSLTAVAVSDSSLLLSINRIQLGATTGASSGDWVRVQTGAQRVWRGSAANVGGFFVSGGFASSDANGGSQGHIFFGASSVYHGPAINAWALATHSVGVGATATQNTLRVRACDGAAATEIDLGAGFPVGPGLIAFYSAQFFCPPNSNFVGYTVRRLDTGAEASGILTTNLPGASTLLYSYIQRAAGASPNGISMQVSHLYSETEV
jgi:hypothetical protein